MQGRFSTAPFLIPAVFALTLLERPLLSGGWLWDMANALGYLAFALALYLCMDTGGGTRQRTHRRLGIATAVCTIAHVLILWIPDETIWSYAQFSAPLYMWAAWGALIAILATIAFALPRRRRSWHANHALFKRWHWWLSLTVIALSAWHIIGSGFYLRTIEVPFIALLCIGAVYLGSQELDSAPSNLVLITGMVAGTLLFVGLKFFAPDYA